MRDLTVLALRAVLAMGLAGSIFVQVVMVPVIARDLDGPGIEDVRIPLVVIMVLGIVSIQVILVAVWRVLTMVRRGTVFSHAAFRYVDVVIGALAAASLLTFGFAVALAVANKLTPAVVSATEGDTVAPGIVLLICGAGGLIAGGALIVLLLRMLLAQAIARDAEAYHLQAELDEVI